MCAAEQSVLSWLPEFLLGEVVEGGCAAFCKISAPELALFFIWKGKKMEEELKFEELYEAYILCLKNKKLCK